MTVKELVVLLEHMPQFMEVRDWAGYDIEKVFIDKEDNEYDDEYEPKEFVRIY